LEVGQDVVPPDAPVYSWPLAMPPAAYEVNLSEATSFGQTKLIVGTDAAALRGLRAQGLSDAEAAPGRFYGPLFVEPRGFEAVFRDDLGFTNRADGLWSPPN
jgi:hypothetical protein